MTRDGMGDSRTGASADEWPDDVDPWAPGGAMARVPDAAAGDIRLSFESQPPARSAPQRPDRRAWLIGGGAAIIAAVGVFVLLGGDDAPPEPGEAVDIEVQPFPEVTDPPPPTAPRPTPPPLLADMPPVTASPNPTERLVLSAAPREFVVDVAPELADINPTEVVALQSDEGLYEVSLPSGRVRVSDLGFFTGQTQMVATDQAAVIWPTPEGTAQVITTQRSVFIPDSRVDRVTWSPGVERMYLWTSQSFANGYESAVVAIDGKAPQVNAVAVEWIDEIDDPARLLGFDGGLLRRDTGGTFSVGPDGATLLTTGDVISNGPNHLLLRECDATRACSLVSVGVDGGRTEWPIDLPDGINPQQLAGLSPGGDALLAIDDRVSADVPSELQVLELNDGSMQPLQASPIFEGFASWDTTGAGVFYADRQLLYFDRFSGEAVVVSEDLPRLRSVRTRRPADTPFCEVLEIALLRFDEMAAGGVGNSISAPDRSVLDSVVALAPEAVVVDATTLADFVNEFVSPDVAESQNVANWPARVTEGLDTLDSFAAAECRFAGR